MTDDPIPSETWSRRSVLAAIGAGAVLPSLSACTQSATPFKEEVTVPMLSDPLHYSSVAALAAAVRSKEVSSEELVRHHLARIEAVNGDLNAVVQLAGDRAIEEARRADAALAAGNSLGALHGVPMTVKDSFDTEGVISTGGTTGRASFIPSSDATAVRRLREAGAILLGKTNTPELTLSYETDNLIYGRTKNPYDLERTSGGSSGGAAAILAAGGSPFDIGSDYGGSVRLPSHCCGTAGIKPTTGRVPRTGHIYPPGGMLDSFQQIGPMCRQVGDLSLLLSVIAGPDGKDPAIAPAPLGDPADVDVSSLRIQFHVDNGIAEPTAETATTVRRAVEALGDEVASIAEGRPPGIEASFEICTALWAADGGAATRRLLLEYGTTDSSLGAIERSDPLSAEEIDALIHRWDVFRRDMLTVFQSYDVLLSPVNASPALPHGTSTTGSGFVGFSYTMTHNLTGWPGAVVRCGTSDDGLPIGVQIVAAPWREDVALAVAERLESALGGFVAPSA
jgi:amidase